MTKYAIVEFTDPIVVGDRIAFPVVDVVDDPVTASRTFRDSFALDDDQASELEHGASDL